MQKPGGAEPSDTELIRFAASILIPPLEIDEETLRDTVQNARDLWLLLYQLSPNGTPAPEE